MTTASLIIRTRMELQDTGIPFAANIPVDGISTVFDLPVESISSTAVPPFVILGGVVISGTSTPAYWIDYKHGVISFFTAPQPQGAILGIQGIYYDYFDDDEVAQAVIDAFNLHVNDQDPLPVIDPVVGQPSLDSTEEMLVGILAAVELLRWRSTDTSQQIDVHTPEGVSISRAQRFMQLRQQIGDLEERYNKMAAALGVGLYRIQILNVRRVSYQTGRYVPLFRAQEIDQPYSGFYPTTGVPGAIIKIYGKWFANPANPLISPIVTFGGVASQSVTVISDCEIDAIVPAGAVTGQIGVTTPYGTVLSTAQFVVGEPAPFILYGPERVKVPIPPGK